MTKLKGEALFSYLEKSGLNPRLVDGGKQANCDCKYPGCEKEKHLYVVLEEHEKSGKIRLPGYHMCQRCGNGGGFTLLKRTLGDFPDIWIPGKSKNRKVGESLLLRSPGSDRIKTPSVVPPEGLDLEYHQSLKDAYLKQTRDRYAKVAISWLIDERSIPWETLEKFNIGFGWVEVGSKEKGFRNWPFVCYPYYSVNGTLINFKYRLVNPEDFGMKKKVFIKYKGCESHPYGIEKLDFENKSVIIVEGENDLLSLDHYGFANVISLPNGAKNWEHKWSRYLSEFEDIFICVDNDEVGQEVAPVLAERLGKLRCSNVLLPLKDANECLCAGYTDKQMRGFFDAYEPFPGGQIVDIGDFEDLLVQRLKGGEETVGVSTGFENLDELFVGWRQSEVTVLTGDTGTGKTTFTAWLAMNLAENGVNTLYCPFEMKPVEMMTKLVAMRAGRQFLELDEKTVRENVREIRDEIPLCFLDTAGQIGIPALVEVIKYAARYLGIGAFVIDPLQQALEHQGDSSRERQEIIQAMIAFRALADSLAIRIIMVVHPTKLPENRKKTRKVELDDLPGSARIKQDANNVLRIWVRMDKTGVPTPHVEFTILKVRSEFARPGTVYFHFDPDTLKYHEMKPHQLAKKQAKPPQYGEEFGTQKQVEFLNDE